MENEWGVISVSSDNMIASISKKQPPVGEVYTITQTMVQDLLFAEGVKVNPDLDAIKYLIEGAAYDEDVIVARGKYPVNGEDGVIDFKINPDDAKAKPVINEDGTVDYRNSLKLAIVDEGDVIATYKKPTPGQYGFDVYTKMVAPVPGKEQRTMHGHGILYDAEKLTYYAEYAGHVVQNGSSYKIERLYRVNGDVDIETGNITFNGDVDVSGDVRSGMMIHADGDVFIHGHVGACTIISKKNITISKGIQGRDQCLIKAKKNVTCKFVERCRIEAEENVYADSILHSTVIARQQVVVNTSKGAVISSNICGMIGVIVKEAGNDSETPTILQSGVPREEIRRVHEMEHQLRELEEKAKTLEQHQRTLETISNPAQEIVDVRAKVMRAKVVVSSEQKRIHDEIDPIKTLMEHAKRESKIHVIGAVHPGVNIHINGVNYIVERPIMDVIYRVRLSDNKIVYEAGE
ncbi:MAG: FapA family protein [Lachnospiraceae bacterium]|nr:FapA family protein [Lachnospiraceae bacterium]